MRFSVSRQQKIGGEAVEIAQMWVSVVADTKDFYSSMNNIEQRMKAAEASSKKLLAGVAAAGAGLLAFGYNAITAGAELQAMEAQIDQVFGALESDAMNAVNRLSEDFDMLPNRIKPAFTSMTSMFKGLGYDTADAMKMAEDAVTLAADAAAFYDKSYEDANAALNSFLKGNYEGGEAIGLFANETQMAAYAASELKMDWQNLDEAGKQLVRLDYAAAMQAAAGATGQAARESDSYANQMGNLKQAWTDFAAVIGEPLLEPIIGQIKNISGGLVELKEVIEAEGIKGAINEIFSTEVQYAIIGVAGAITAALIPAFVGIATAAWAAIVPLAPFLAAGAAVAALAFTIYKNWEPIKNFFVNTWQGIEDTVVTTVENVKTKISEMIQAGKDFVMGLWEGISSSTTEIVRRIKSWFGDNIIGVAKEKITEMIQIGKDVAAGLWKGLSDSADWLKNKVMGWIKSVLPDPILKALNILSPSKVMADIGLWAAKGLALGLGEGQDGVITQAQLLADHVTSVRDRLQALNREYEITKIVQGENSDSAQKLREQIAELAKQYDALSGSVVKADESQKKWAGTLGMINTLVAAFTGTKKSGKGGRSTPKAGEDWGFDYSGPVPGSDESGIPSWGAGGPDLPSYDVGGIVPGPIGMPQLAIVHGGEEVIPPGRQNSGGQMDIQINLDGRTLTRALLQYMPGELARVGVR